MTFKDDATKKFHREILPTALYSENRLSSSSNGDILKASSASMGHMFGSRGLNYGT